MHSPRPMLHADRFAIAARVRALLGSQDSGNNMSALAHRIGVDELELRMTVHDRSPRPVVGVLAAIVTEYGVDPTWLVTGQYDSAMHRQALDADPVSGMAMLRRLIDSQTEEAPVTDRNEGLAR